MADVKPTEESPMDTTAPEATKTDSPVKTVTETTEQKKNEETSSNGDAATETKGEQNGHTEETPVVDIADKTSEATADKTSEATADKTSEDTAEKTSEDTADKSAEDSTKTADKSAEDSTKTADKSAEESTKTADKPSEESTKTSEESTKTSEESTKTSEESTKTSEDSADKTSEGPADPELSQKIVKQIEYYFGNYNLPRDKFLSSEVKKDDGWVPMDVMLKFARLAKLSPDAAVIVAALKDAETFMEVDGAGSKIRRSTDQPLPELSEGLQEESIKRTIYCKGFLKDGSVTLDLLLEYFKQFGEYDSVRMRNYVDRTSNLQGFKGSVLVVFKTEELAKTFLEAPPMHYKKSYLTRKWFSEYLGEKRKEMEERQARRQARQDNPAGANGQEKDEQPKFEELPRGNFLRATGFAESTRREDIKEAIINLIHDCAFVDFRQGDETAYIRFMKADSNKEILSALEGNLTVNSAKISLFLVEGEEEEAQLQKANEARRKSHAAGPYTKKRKAGGGGYGGRGKGRNKRQRTH